MKRWCNKCLHEKKTLKCYKKRNSFQPSCKKCQLKERTAFNHSKKGLISIMYTTQLRSSKKRNMPAPTYSRVEFHEWLHSQKKFHKLYDNWQRLDFQKDYVPSVDRKNNSIGYTMSNIQLITWLENKTNGELSNSNGDFSNSVSVTQLSLGGDFIATYTTMSKATKESGVGHKEIRKVISGEHSQAGGFLWQKN